eukprot:COSAG02_NODE_794_length_17142_cov_13.622367_2_plen_73_part_00
MEDETELEAIVADGEGEAGSEVRPRLLLLLRPVLLFQGHSLLLAGGLGWQHSIVLQPSERAQWRLRSMLPWD